MSRFLALDFETSGLVPGTHAPVSLGIALFDGGEPVQTREWLFAPPMYKDKISRAYDVVALEISGASWVRIKREGVPHAKVCAELGALAKEWDAGALTVVAFNAPFDLSWYSDLLFLGGSWDQHTRSYKTFTPPLYGPWQCVRLAAAADPRVQLDSYSLDTVADHFGLARSGEKHGALEDAILAGQIWHRLQETK